jgi:3D-(3,5/4)-trihydroxycyclohexane-1,2-dione acylhydrolase (decyclizing)
MVGDGSYLMMSQEIVTAVQEGIKLTIILIDNHGFASIGGLSESLGSDGFGTRYLARNERTGQLDGANLPVDFPANARSLGAHVIKAKTILDLRMGLEEAKTQTRTTVICVETDREQRVGGYESWWDVPIAQTSEMESVQEAHRNYVESKKKERYFL